MSRGDGHTSAPPLPVGLPADELRERLDKLERLVTRGQAKVSHAGIPLKRKYTYEEAGIRLVQCEDPATLPEERRQGLSKTTVYRLVEKGEIRALKIMGSVFITEAEVQNYERRLS